MTFWAIWKRPISGKTTAAIFWATLGEIGPLFSSTSGHTGLTHYELILVLSRLKDNSHKLHLTCAAAAEGCEAK